MGDNSNSDNSRQFHQELEPNTESPVSDIIEQRTCRNLRSRVVSTVIGDKALSEKDASNLNTAVTAIEDGDESQCSIKSRLRHGSGRTPKKSKGKTIAADKVNKEDYIGERQAIQTFLNKQQECDGVNTIRCTTNKNEEVLINSTNIGESNPSKGDQLSKQSENATTIPVSSDCAAAEDQRSMEGIKDIDATPNSSSNSVTGRKEENSGNMAELPTTRGSPVNEIDRLENELKYLEGKIAKTPKDSMEFMLLEMRIDMKKDSLAVLHKMDKVTMIATKYETEISTIKTTQIGFENRLRVVQDIQEEEKKTVKTVVHNTSEVRDQIHILHGLLLKQRQIQEIEKIKQEQSQLSNMRNNLLITGLDEKSEESETATAEMVTDFFSQTMKIPQAVGMRSAVRIGTGNPRTVLVKLKNNADKKEVFKCAPNLKNVRNNNDGEYYVNSQLPPRLQEQKRWYRWLMKHNAGLTGVGKCTLNIRRGELYVNNQVYRPPVTPPNSSEIMYPADMAHVNRIKLNKGKSQIRGGCCFIGYTAEVKTVADVRAAYTKVVRLNANALHVACSYRLAGVDYINLRGYADDHEYGAGRTLYMMLENKNIYGKALFMVRYYGNKHLGPARFTAMRDAVQTALDAEPARLPGFNPSLTGGARGSSKEWDDEVSFKRPESIRGDGYSSVVSPRPFTMPKNWASTESLELQKSEWSQCFRSRASSLESGISYASFRSVKDTTSWAEANGGGGDAESQCDNTDIESAAIASVVPHHPSDQ